MPDPSFTLHTISGLDDRDLALLAAACADRANHLVHHASRRYNHPDSLGRVSHDADRLNYIAKVLAATVTVDRTAGQERPSTPP